ncbi:MAG: hypothetical protein KAJ55_08200 [Anaerolineales bacterium]|nr:hypothetical protein [Anaerolineales bacterium]
MTTRADVREVIRTDVNTIVTAWQAKYSIVLPVEPKAVLVDAISTMMEAGVDSMLAVIGAEDDSPEILN